VIESSNILVYSHGGEFSSFVGARIVAGIMQFIANCVMISPNAPGNIICRGRVVALSEVFHVDLLTAVQKTRNKCIGVLYVRMPHSMNFSY
jgi:hypothetical protein